MLSLLPKRRNQDRGETLNAGAVFLVEAGGDRAVQIEHADKSPALTSGTTSSEREFGSQAIWPGNSCTSGTITEAARDAAVPHTPFPHGMRTQAGLPWNGPRTSSRGPLAGAPPPDPPPLAGEGAMGLAALEGARRSLYLPPPLAGEGWGGGEPGRIAQRAGEVEAGPVQIRQPVIDQRGRVGGIGYRVALAFQQRGELGRQFVVERLLALIVRPGSIRHVAGDLHPAHQPAERPGIVHRQMLDRAVVPECH